ncbi:hypothetical protein BDV19DRAFT_383847 [Aspergillus venezuelensis]
MLYWKKFKATKHHLLNGRHSPDLSAGPEPLHKPTPSSPHVLIIGAGVTGLVTVWMLLDRGYLVTIISKEWATYETEQRITSQTSDALWELPPTQCGRVHAVDQAMDAGDLSTSAAMGNREFPGLSRDSSAPGSSACFWRDHANLHVIPRVQNGFDWGTHRFEKRGANRDAHRGLKDAYKQLAPVVDTGVAMGSLMKLVRGKGASFHTDTIKGSLLGQEDRLLQYYKADVIVNATGLGAREVAEDDETYPLRGAVLLVTNDGSSFPKVTGSLIVTAETNDDGTYEDNCVHRPTQRQYPGPWLN